MSIKIIIMPLDPSPNEKELQIERDYIAMKIQELNGFMLSKEWNDISEVQKALLEAKGNAMLNYIAVTDMQLKDLLNHRT